MRFKNLREVSISPLTLLGEDQKSRSKVLTRIDVPDQVTHSSLGLLNREGFVSYRTHECSFFGHDGFIPLPQLMLNPSFEAIMSSFLKLISYDPLSNELFFKDGIPQNAVRHSDKYGHRRLMSIVEDESNQKTTLKLDADRINFIYDDGSMVQVFRPEDLYKLLRKFEAEEGTKRVLQDIGINTDIALPSNAFISAIPVIPNPLRVRNSKFVKDHPLTTHYRKIAGSQTLPEIRKEYLNMMEHSTNGTPNLKELVFTSDKHGFIRGSMFSKVSGRIGRAVVSPDPIFLRPDQVGLPQFIAKDLTKKVIVTRDNIDEIRDMIKDGNVKIIHRTGIGYVKISKWSEDFERKKGKRILEPNKSYILRPLWDGDMVVLNRQPTLHKYSSLGFYVKIHEEDTIKVHPSVVAGFGMDFDGDEGNINAAHRKNAENEIKYLMNMKYNMRSSTSGALMTGYHQDVNIGAHILTLLSTTLTRDVWEKMIQMVWDHMWVPLLDGTRPQCGYTDKCIMPWNSYEDWLQDLEFRCERHGIPVLSGRCIFSAMIPPDLNWKSDVKDGILVKGVMNASNASKAPSSLGTRIHEVYGPNIALNWLDASYKMIMYYMQLHGTSLSLEDLRSPNGTDPQEITNTKRIMMRNTLSNPALNVDVEKIRNPVVRLRRSEEQIQILNNIREKISTYIIDRGNDVERYTPDLDTEIHIVTGEERIIKLDSDGESRLLLDTYQGKATYRDTVVGYTSISFYVDGDSIRKRYKLPNPLRMMIESKARGNATNAIQMAGIIGQQVYSGGRYPRMMTHGTRTLPSFPPGGNSPKSRGFVESSYLEGMGPDENFISHAITRENLISNRTLTPETGYFGRRLRVFNENLTMTSDSHVVKNEIDTMIMYDYTLNPEHLFIKDGYQTFIDVENSVPPQRSRDAIYMKIPLHSNLYSIYRYIEYLIGYTSSDIILVADENVSKLHHDFYTYIQNMDPRIVLLTVEDNEYWYMALSEYDIIYVLSPGESIEGLPGEVDVGEAYIRMSRGIHRLSYRLGRGAISNVTIAQMLIQGFEPSTIVINPQDEIYEELSTYSLLGSLLRNNYTIYSI